MNPRIFVSDGDVDMRWVPTHKSVSPGVGQPYVPNGARCNYLCKSSHPRISNNLCKGFHPRISNNKVRGKQDQPRISS
jgi:hypothetical protein